jgi:tungstate transport system ATP-binding protein
MSEVIYQLQNVSRRYGQREVLRIDMLEVYAGEVLAIVGPSGSGKSTLLRLLNFLEEPSEGTILFQDIPFGQGRQMPTDLRREVTTVFQHPHLLNRSVAANVQYGLQLRRRANSHALAVAALDQVGLGEMANQRARTLSGGEAQRVALARALVIQPEVLLLDEPTANLDPYNVVALEKGITRFNQERGATIILVTHNVFQARRLAGRVALLLDGRIIEVQDAQQFFESPGDPRTAAFIRGEMVY